MKKLLTLITLAGSLSLALAQNAPAPAGVKVPGASASASAPVKAKKKAAPTAQQAKMKTCNVEAKSQKLKGDARKKFMSSCLKG